MIEAGCRLKSFHAPEDDLAAAYGAKHIPVPRASPTRREILEDPEIRLVLGAGILADRAPMAVRAMRHGKDVMLDKPGATTLAQLDELRRTQAETGRILSILYSEHYTQRATVAAGDLVKAGAIGRVLQTVGPRAAPPRQLRPAGLVLEARAHRRHPDRHRLAPGRAVPFLHRQRHGRDRRQPGRQFRASGDARVRGFRRHRCSVPPTRRATSASTGSRRTGCRPGATAGCSSSAPKARSSSGNTSTSPAARAAIICSSSTGRELATSTARRPRSPMASKLRDDVIDRTETAMPQEHCFRAMELALTAQARATRITGARPAGTRRMTQAFQGRRGRRRRRREPHPGVSGAARPLLGRGAFATSIRRGRDKVGREYGVGRTVTSTSTSCSTSTSTSSTSAPPPPCISSRRSKALARRPARRGRKAVRRLSRRGRRAGRAGAEVGKAPSPDLPVPLRRRHRAAPASQAGRFRRPAPMRDGRDALAPRRRPITTIPGGAAGRPSSAARSSRTPSTTTIS